MPSNPPYTSASNPIGAASIPRSVLANPFDTDNDGIVDQAESALSADAVAWANVTGKPSTFPPDAHTHDASGITSGTFDVSSRLSVPVFTPQTFLVSDGGTGVELFSGFAYATFHMDSAGTGLVEIKNHFSASTAPTVNDDGFVGYGVGSVWYDLTNDKAYVCLDSTTSAAVWKETTGGGSSAVSSVFGRTGAVAAAASDYDASQVDNDSGVTGTTVADALNQLDTDLTNSSNWDTAYGWGDHASAGYLTDITGEALSTLSDVTITSIAANELLKWNGSAWINNTIAEAGIASSADIANASNWDTAFGWGDHSSAGYLTDITGEALSTLSDVTITTIASNEILKWNGSAWINNTLAEAGIATTSDVANSANWDTAYGWGDHSSAGYLSALEDDGAPILGANLDTGGNSIDDSINLYVSFACDVDLGTNTLTCGSVQSNVASGTNVDLSASTFVFNVGSVSQFEVKSAEILANQIFRIKENTAPAGTPTAGSGYLYANSSDSKLYWKDDSGTAHDLTGAGGGGVSPQPIQLDSGAWYAPVTNGAAPGFVELATNDVALPTFDFDDTTQEYVQCRLKVPADWDGNDITVQIEWTVDTTPSGTSTDAVKWNLQTLPLANDEQMDAAWSTADTVTDTANTTAGANKIYETAAFTVAAADVGTAGEMLFLRLSRHAGDAADEIVGDVKFISATFHFAYA